LDISELYRQKDKLIKRHPWEVTRAKIIHFLLKKQKNKFRHIADIGSGDAFVLSLLESSDFAGNYSAIDNAYNPKIINHLQSLVPGKIRFYNSTEQIPSSAEQTDCILLLDVLEHCENDQVVLTGALSSNLTSSVTVLVTVPAFQKLFSSHDKVLKHYRRYTRKTVAELCTTSGLSINKSGYFFFSLLPLRIMQVLLEKMGKGKTTKTIDNWRGGTLLSKLISSILWIDFRLCYFLSSLGINLPGLSCYCLCQKSPS
jgi:hypothetical protein